jgi:protease IV
MLEKSGKNPIRTAFLASIIISLFLSLSSLNAKPVLPGYQDYNQFFMGTPAALSGAPYVMANPAVLAMIQKPDITFGWSDINGKSVRFDRWGLFAAFPYLGFGMNHWDNGSSWVNDYKVSLGFGNRSAGMGIGYGWSSGDQSAFNRSAILTIGTLFRPNTALSFGLTGNFLPSNDESEGILDLAVRPLKKKSWTLFGDFSSQDLRNPDMSGWSFGTLVEPLEGLQFSVRYSSLHILSCGVQFGFGHSRLAVQPKFDTVTGHKNDIYTLDMGGYQPGLGRSLLKKSKYVTLNLLGNLKYQRSSFFDKSQTLISLLSTIDAAGKDMSIAGLVINMSGMKIPGEMKWEIAQKLKDFRATGRQVIIYLDNAGISDYAFTSASADKIIIDPLGGINLMGISAGRVYVKETLKKLGIGFDEWRFFKYKSAVEMFARTNMSEADREQTAAYLESVYGVLKKAICESRNIGPEKFESLVNDPSWFSPEEALKNGLVDRIAHWENIREVMNNISGSKKVLAGPQSIVNPVEGADKWGEPRRIAVIYALGVCDMDSGITARKLVKDIERAEKDPSISAVVFRVDSPGGSALASDIIAEALKKCKVKKPVVVTQGAVAGSGGYWLSMYGDPIVSSPITITGSIGVIGGWIYNTGFKEKIGLNTDVVKIGEHSDLGQGIPLLFFGSLPDRNLTDMERKVMERQIRGIYTNFLRKVASGRNKKTAEIDEIGQGRIWSGLDAKENGLVDVIGGLQTAMDIARQKAHFTKDEEFKIIELPRRDPSDWKAIISDLNSAVPPENELLTYLKFRITQNGQAMLLMPYEVYKEK